MNGAGIMANEQNEQGHASKPGDRISDATELTDEQIAALAGAADGPGVQPWVPLKPDWNKKIQNQVDGILKNGGTVHSVNYETGAINFTMGPGEPYKDITR
jgi:hypothetical protein